MQAPEYNSLEITQQYTLCTYTQQPCKIESPLDKLKLKNEKYPALHNI